MDHCLAHGPHTGVCPECLGASIRAYEKAFGKVERLDKALAEARRIPEQIAAWICTYPRHPGTALPYMTGDAKALATEIRKRWGRPTDD